MLRSPVKSHDALQFITAESESRRLDHLYLSQTLPPPFDAHGHTSFIFVVWFKQKASFLLLLTECWCAGGIIQTVVHTVRVFGSRWPDSGPAGPQKHHHKTTRTSSHFRSTVVIDKNNVKIKYLDNRRPFFSHLTDHQRMKNASLKSRKFVVWCFHLNFMCLP